MRTQTICQTIQRCIIAGCITALLIVTVVQVRHYMMARQITGSIERQVGKVKITVEVEKGTKCDRD